MSLLIPDGWPNKKNKRPRSPDPDVIINEERSAPRSVRFDSTDQARIKRESSDSPQSLDPDLVVDEERSTPPSVRLDGSDQARIKRESSDSRCFSTPLSQKLASIFSGTPNSKTSPQSIPDRSTIENEVRSPAPDSNDNSGKSQSCHGSADDGLEHPDAESDWEIVGGPSSSEDEDSESDMEIAQYPSGSEGDDSDSEPEAPLLEDFDIKDAQEEVELNSRNSKMPQKPKVERRKPAKTPGEYFQRKQKDRLEKSMGKQRKSKRERQMEKEIHQGLMNYDHLAPNEAQQNGALPEFKAGTKKEWNDQLNKVLGVPVAKMKNNTMSRSELAEAFTSFGLRNMKVVNDKFLNKKMNSGKHITSALFRYRRPVNKI